MLDFNIVRSYLTMTQYQNYSAQKLTQFKDEALVPRITFTSTTAKLWRLFLQLKSTLIREYSSRSTSPKPLVVQICLHHHLTFLRAKYGLRRLLPQWSGCPGYLYYTGEQHQEADHNTFHRWLVFIVSAALSQAKSWRAQSPNRKTPCQNSKFHTRRRHIPLLHHLVNLS